MDFDPLRMEMIKQEIMNQVTENLQDMKAPQEETSSDVDVKKEIK